MSVYAYNIIILFVMADSACTQLCEYCIQFHFHMHMHAGSLAPFEVDLKLWPKEQCFEAAVSMLQCLGLR